MQVFVLHFRMCFVCLSFPAGFKGNIPLRKSVFASGLKQVEVHHVPDLKPSDQAQHAALCVLSRAASLIALGPTSLQTCISPLRGAPISSHTLQARCGVGKGELPPALRGFSHQFLPKGQARIATALKFWPSIVPLVKPDGQFAGELATVVPSTPPLRKALKVGCPWSLCERQEHHAEQAWCGRKRRSKSQGASLEAPRGLAGNHGEGVASCVPEAWSAVLELEKNGPPRPFWRPVLDGALLMLALGPQKVPT